MCLAIPGEIVEIFGTTAIVDYGGIRKNASLLALPDGKIGEMVMVHAGFVIARVDREEAEETLSVYKELGSIIESEKRRTVNGTKK